MISVEKGWKKKEGELLPEEKDDIYFYVNSQVGRTVS